VHVRLQVGEYGSKMWSVMLIEVYRLIVFENWGAKEHIWT